MDHLVTLLMLSLGLSLDDFGIAVALSLLTLTESLKRRMIYAGKIAVAFSVSTALLPLAGWALGLAVYGWLESYGDWIVLAAFCGVGSWIILEALKEHEEPKVTRMDSYSFWILVSTGTLGSIDEGIVGVSYPFLEIPVQWIIAAVIMANTLLVYVAMLLGIWMKRLSGKTASIISGAILISIGILNFFS